MSQKSFVLEFNPNEFQESALTEYFKGATGKQAIEVKDVFVYTTNEDFSYAIVDCVTATGEAVSCNSLPLEGKSKEGKLEEKFGYPILRSLLGVTFGKKKIISVTSKDKKGKTCQIFKAVRGAKCQAMLQKQYKIYTSNQGEEKVSQRYNIKRFYNSDNFTASEIIANATEAKVYLTDIKLIKDKYKDCDKEEIDAMLNTGNTNSEAPASLDDENTGALDQDDSTTQTDNTDNTAIDVQTDVTNSDELLDDLDALDLELGEV